MKEDPQFRQSNTNQWVCQHSWAHPLCGPAEYHLQGRPSGTLIYAVIHQYQQQNQPAASALGDTLIMKSSGPLSQRCFHIYLYESCC